MHGVVIVKVTSAEDRRHWGKHCMKNTRGLKPVCVGRGGDRWSDVIMLVKGKEMTYMTSPSSRHTVAMSALENSPSGDKSAAFSRHF